MESPREVYALVEEKCGRWIAKLTFFAMVVGTIAAGLLGFGALVGKIDEKLVSPYVTPAIKSARLPSVDLRFQEVITSALVTMLLVGGLKYFAWRRFRAFERVLVRVIRDVVWRRRETP